MCVYVIVWFQGVVTYIIYRTQLNQDAMDAM